MEKVEAFEVLAGGILTTFQDLGRLGFGRYGVAPSGALDPFALQVANLLVDNPEDEAAIEITLTGFKARTLVDLAVAVTGGDLGLQCSGKPLSMWRTHGLKKDEVVSFDSHRSGCRAYLTVGGGFCLPDVLGSRSTNLGSGFGGLGGRPLHKGDILYAAVPDQHLHTVGRYYDFNFVPDYKNNWDIRVVPGPQDHQFSETGLNTFFNTWYTVSPQSDRTGVRFQGEPIKTRPAIAESILSEGLIPGSIQVPGDGQPIILLGETVSGGYRKIAAVISADLALVGQMMPGDRVRFQAVSIREARRALWRQKNRIARFRDSLG